MAALSSCMYSALRLCAHWYWVLLATVIWDAVTSSEAPLGSEPKRCDREVVQESVYSCLHYFGRLQSTILRVGHDDNHTAICEDFTSYVQCVEPRVVGCQTSRFRALRHYTEDKMRLTSSPFLCQLPSEEVIFNGTYALDYRSSVSAAGYIKAHALLAGIMVMHGIICLQMQNGYLI